jgi:[ribosomal protein S5]-alanine N-acetyltransferase
MLETPRLTLIPLTLEQVRLHIAGGTLLEEAMGVRPGHRLVEEPLMSIIRHFTIPFLQNPTRQPLYDTLWIALDRELNQFVADTKFKGPPDEDDHSVEIGYGTYPAFQQRGYMTEIVGSMVGWALAQPGVERVVAETALANVASQQVLLNNRFVPFGQDERVRWWERF